MWDAKLLFIYLFMMLFAFISVPDTSLNMEFCRNSLNAPSSSLIYACHRYEPWSPGHISFSVFFLDQKTISASFLI